MIALLKRRLPVLLAVIPLCAEEKVEVLDVRMPAAIAWGTNLLTLTVRNTGARPHEIDLNVRCKSSGPGFQWGTTHVIAARSESTIERDFIVPAVPGKHALTIRVTDTTTSSQAFLRDTAEEFPIANQRTNPLRLPVWRLETDPALKPAYPRLLVESKGHFAVYYLEGDRYVETRIDGIAERREQSYGELAAKINPAFDDPIALFLFPDGASKLAYMGHEGDGLAFGRLLAEVFNEKTQLDPYHELTHIIAGTVGSPPALFNEGLAAYMQEGHRWNGYHVDAWSKAFAARGALWPLPKLFTFDDIGPSETKPGIAYPEAASVIGYLAGRHGFEKVMAAYKVLKNDPDAVAANREAFTRIFGATVEEVEKAWRASLAQAQSAPPPDALFNEQY